MKNFSVLYRPTALEDLQSIYAYVLEASQDTVTAKRYTDRIFDKCNKIGLAPHGYPERNDLAGGIRLVPFESSAVILNLIEDETVCITNIFAGGRDYEALLRHPNNKNN